MLCDTEMQLQPSCTYLELHSPCVSPDLFLDATMRRTATSWLVEVAAEFGLHQETLFLATALLDRFLSSAKVGKGRWCCHLGQQGGALRRLHVLRSLTCQLDSMQRSCWKSLLQLCRIMLAAGLAVVQTLPLAHSPPACAGRASDAAAAGVRGLHAGGRQARGGALCCAMLYHAGALLSLLWGFHAPLALARQAAAGACAVAGTPRPVPALLGPSVLGAHGLLPAVLALALCDGTLCCLLTWVLVLGCSCGCLSAAAAFRCCRRCTPRCWTSLTLPTTASW